jgi:serine protease Do
VLKIPARKLPAGEVGRPRKVKRGQWTIAIGNPYGLAAEGEMCMSVGVVSAIGRSLPKLSGKEDRLYSDLIQTTAQINPGNSGGRCSTSAARSFGINAAVILPQKQTNGIGFAIPGSPRVMQIIDSLKRGNEVVYGYLGVKATTPTARERQSAKIADDVGALVESIEPARPPPPRGSKTGDIVVRFNGETIHDGDEFIRCVGAAPIDEKGVSAVIVRGDRRQELTLKLRRREIAQAAVTKRKADAEVARPVLGPVPPTGASPARRRRAASASWCSACCPTAPSPRTARPGRRDHRHRRQACRRDHRPAVAPERHSERAMRAHLRRRRLQARRRRDGRLDPRVKPRTRLNHEGTKRGPDFRAARFV